MAAAAIFENTLPVEPPLWERNSWFVTTRRKSNFVGVILTFKSSLLSRAQMLKRFPQQIGQVQKRVEILVFFEPETPKREFEVSKPRKGTCTKQNTSFEQSSVRIGWKLRSVGEMRKWKKNIHKNGRTKVTKVWYFTTVWRRLLWTDLNQIWCVCRSNQRYHLGQNWF